MSGTGMVRRFFVLLLLGLSICSYAHAEESQLETAEIVITTGVRDRLPVDALQSYTASVGALYCYSRITGAQTDVTVWHVWYCEDREVARVALPVRSSNWRTWSRKTMAGNEKGFWRVEVLDGRGELLASTKFQLL